MTRLQLSRRLAVALAVLCCALPAAAFVARLTIFFFASFDPASAPNNPPPAEVGQFDLPSQPSEFVVVPGPGGGQLKIEDTGTTAEVSLEAEFKKVFKGSDIDLSWTLTAQQTDSTFIVRAGDQGGTGLIDCTIGGDGSIRVGGVDTGFDYQPGVAYQLKLTLQDPLAGMPTWTLHVQTGDQPAYEATGSLNLTGPLTVKSMKLIRPANDHGGKFLVDDLQAASQTYAVGF